MNFVNLSKILLVMRALIIPFLVLFMSCGSAKNTATTAQLNQLKNIVNTKNFEVNFDWANPLGINSGVVGLQNLMPPGSNINNISLIGNPNYFKVQKDSISMELPYYGQQRMSRGYNTDSGVKFEGKPTNYSAIFNENKNTYTLKYALKGEEESYDIILTLFPNKSSNLSLISSHRTSINYTGSWKELEIDE